MDISVYAMAEYILFYGKGHCNEEFLIMGMVFIIIDDHVDAVGSAYTEMQVKKQTVFKLTTEEDGL